ncbi:MAG: Crp/Fnr family transcriptional regulator [Cyanobacteria bacterium J06621_12]
MSRSITETDSLFFNSGGKLPTKDDHLWLIVSGVVKSYTVTEEGSLVILGFWGADDLIGKPLSNINPYTLECIGSVQVIAVPRQQWQGFADNLLHHAQQSQHMSYIVRNTKIARRLWLLLEWLAEKFGKAIAQGRLIDFKLTHQELANAISTTRITVTKTLRQFEIEGLILRPRTKCIVLRSKNSEGWKT